MSERQITTKQQLNHKIIIMNCCCYCYDCCYQCLHVFCQCYVKLRESITTTITRPTTYKQYNGTQRGGVNQTIRTNRRKRQDEKHFFQRTPTKQLKRSNHLQTTTTKAIIVYTWYCCCFCSH